jgi:hypothetical protein
MDWLILRTIQVVGTNLRRAGDCGTISNSSGKRSSTSGMAAGKIWQKDLMQLKSAFAACLSFCLLCASALASDCELACCLTPSHSVSAAASHLPLNPATVRSAALKSEAANSTMSMPHSHCGHARMMGRGAAVRHLVEDASKCDPALCTQAQVLSSPVSAKRSTQIESRQLAVVAIVSPVGAVASPRATVKLEDAPPRIVLLDPLSVALRT